MKVHNFARLSSKERRHSPFDSSARTVADLAMNEPGNARGLLYSYLQSTSNPTAHLDIKTLVTSVDALVSRFGLRIALQYNSGDPSPAGGVFRSRDPNCYQPAT
jgi:hypothetical protein